MELMATDGKAIHATEQTCLKYGQPRKAVVRCGQAEARARRRHQQGTLEPLANVKKEAEAESSIAPKVFLQSTKKHENTVAACE